eukprot:913893-Rhodomonas_salina.1
MVNISSDAAKVNMQAHKVNTHACSQQKPAAKSTCTPLLSTSARDKCTKLREDSTGCEGRGGGGHVDGWVSEWVSEGWDAGGEGGRRCRERGQEEGE